MKMKIWKLLTKTAENYFSAERQSLLFIQTDYYSFASILFIFVFHGNQWTDAENYLINHHYFIQTD